MSLVCREWSGCDPAVVEPLYAVEVERWRRELGWEAARSWVEVERGRVGGTVKGFVAFDEAAAVGWTFGLLQPRLLLVGGLVAASEAATALLLDALASTAAGAGVPAVGLFVFPEPPGLARLLLRAGVPLLRYQYLSKRLSERDARLPSEPSQHAGIRPWHAGDVAATAALLAAAYPGADCSRPFAPDGTAAEWRQYVDELVWTSGCGELLREASFVACDERGSPTGAILTTRLAPSTAHVAQLAVQPAAQGRGLGRRLLQQACASARALGCDRVTLLVHPGNRRAARLYAQAGFTPAAQFVSARGPLGARERSALSLAG